MISLQPDRTSSCKCHLLRVEPSPVSPHRSQSPGTCKLMYPPRARSAHSFTDLPSHLLALSGIRSLLTDTCTTLVEVDRSFFGRLAWPSTRTLIRHDGPAFEDLCTPNAPRFPPLQRGVQARRSDRAVRAQRLGALEVVAILGEPQVGIAEPARHRRRVDVEACSGRNVRVTSLSRWLVRSSVVGGSGA